MTGIELFDFQQTAADKLLESSLRYFQAGPDRLGGRPVPFVGQLKAVTGAGKTPILANVIGRLSPAIILWTTKFSSVVDQTAVNLGPGGKYYDQLGSGLVDVVRLSSIGSPPEWRHVLDRTDGLTILISTVAAWYSSEKDDRLNMHRVSPDWGAKSRWDQLKFDRKRPLWVVYDEAHNTTTEQVEQLDDLDPAGFLVASASPVKGKLQRYLTNLDDAARQERIVPVRTRDVVDKQLLKSTISVADYESTAEEMIADAATLLIRLQQGFKNVGVPVNPKAIYVVEASNTTAQDPVPRPTAIWSTLVQKQGVLPDSIAVCTNTRPKDLPAGAIRVEGIEKLADNYTHIIFNKKLQEGWDDPTVYVCYFDGETESGTRIQQVIGRALRQPNATHLSDEELNTAYFFVHCPTDTVEKIVDDLKEELRIYKDAAEPDDWEPFEFKLHRTAPGRIPVKPEHVGKLKVPRLQLELPTGDYLPTHIKKRVIKFTEEDRKAPGRANVNIVSLRTGEITQQVRDLLEDTRIRCGAYLHQQIRSLSRNCDNTIQMSAYSSPALNKTMCYKSKAWEYYRQLAADVVREYETHVELHELADPDQSEYTVGPYQPSGGVSKDFHHAAHASYDSKAFNDDELALARALDKFAKFVWARNKSRLDYGISLPFKSETSSTFYPDFLWWVGGTVWAIDPTGKFLLDEKLRTKLLEVPAPLKIALVTRKKYDTSFHETDAVGWTLLRKRSGITAPETYDGLDDLLAVLVADSQYSQKRGAVRKNRAKGNGAKAARIRKKTRTHT